MEISNCNFIKILLHFCYKKIVTPLFEVTIAIFRRTRREDFLSTKRRKGIDNYLIIKEF